MESRYDKNINKYYKYVFHDIKFRADTKICFFINKYKNMTIILLMFEYVFIYIF